MKEPFQKITFLSVHIAPEAQKGHSNASSLQALMRDRGYTFQGLRGASEGLERIYFVIVLDSGREDAQLQEIKGLCADYSVPFFIYSDENRLTSRIHLDGRSEELGPLRSINDLQKKDCSFYAIQKLEDNTSRLFGVRR